jgi:cholesterol oxidase
LLLRCRDQYKTLPEVSQFLGHHWSSNGDFLTLGRYPESRTIAPSWGPTITCYIDFLKKPYNDQRFVVEDGGFAPFLRDYLEKKISQAEHGIKQPFVKAILDSLARDLRNEDPFGNIMPWFANGVDKGNGQFYLGHKWWWPWGKHLELDWPQSLQPTDTIIAMHTILSQVTGGKEWVSPTWTDLKWLITPHPLGGCNMGTDASNGVVDHAGAVFGYPGLYVADGAIVPEAIGINPSRTIACLSERIAHLIVTEETGRAMPAVAGV